MDKQSILAFRSVSPTTAILGYHHCPIDLRHTSLYCADTKGNTQPLPDIIYTIGEYGRSELIARGFPAEIVKVLGALKQASFFGTAVRPLCPVPDSSLNILVLLGAECTQTHYLFLALMRSGAILNDLRRHKWLFRMHPAYRQPEHFSAAATLDLNYTLSQSKCLADDIDWADIVINNGTAAAVEAMTKGRPVFYVNCKSGLQDNALYKAPALAFEIEGFEDFESKARSALLIAGEQGGDLTQDVADFVNSMYKTGTEEAFAASIRRDLDSLGMD